MIQHGRFAYPESTLPSGKKQDQMIRMEIKERSNLPDRGGGRSANEMVSLSETTLSELNTSTGLIKRVCNAKGWLISDFVGPRKSSRLRKVLFISQHSGLAKLYSASTCFSLSSQQSCASFFFFAQQSSITDSEYFVFPLFKQTILPMVKPKLDTRKVRANKSDVIF